MTTQPSILFALRQEFQFDTLEKVLYLNSLNLLKSNLENKVAQVKEKNKDADTSEQEKMIAVLGECIGWVEGLYHRGQDFMTDYKDQETHIKDLHSINEVLYNKVEALENEIKKLKEQMKF